MSDAIILLVIYIGGFSSMLVIANSITPKAWITKIIISLLWPFVTMGIIAACCYDLWKRRRFK